MASSKDILPPSRPMGQHRSPPFAIPAGSVHRQTHSRSHVAAAPKLLNQGNRVARRNSFRVDNHNVAAVTALAFGPDIPDRVGTMPMAISGGARRPSKPGGLRADRPALMGLSTPMTSHAVSVPGVNYFNNAGMGDPRDNAVDDQDDMSTEDSEALESARERRASDGQPITKEGRKFNRPVITCTHPGCNKQYKHSSCLEKHMWEHTEMWSQTSRLLISKHQQVQILEAAKSLVGISKCIPESYPDSTFEPSSPSLSGGFSEQLDGQSSARTTPPPQMDEDSSHTEMDEMTYSVASDDEEDARGGLSRQFGSDTARAPPSIHRYLEPSPTPAPIPGEADDQLARAMQNCGWTGSTLSFDSVPVPPMSGQMPVHFLAQASLGQSPFLNSFPSQAPESFTRGSIEPAPKGSVRGPRGYRNEEQDRDLDSRMDEDDDDLRSRSRSDEEEDGVFGRMED